VSKTFVTLANQVKVSTAHQAIKTAGGAAIGTSYLWLLASSEIRPISLAITAA